MDKETMEVERNGVSDERLTNRIELTNKGKAPHRLINEMYIAHDQIIELTNYNEVISKCKDKE